MSVLHAEVCEAFRALDMPDEKALRAAAALSAALTSFEDDTAKAFDRRDVDVEAIRKDVSSIKGEIADINMRLAAFQGQVDVRFTSLEAKFDERITSVEDTLGKRITAFHADFDKRIVALQGDMNTRFATAQGEMVLPRWMTGTTIALLVTVLFRVFTH